MEIKCKHCRKLLFDDTTTLIYNAHSERMTSIVDSGCGANKQEHCIYMPMEGAPTWILDIINKECWTKGRIHCPHCNNRIGLFNFINQVKCNCNEFTVPPIQLIWSKLDLIFQ